MKLFYFTKKSKFQLGKPVFKKSFHDSKRYCALKLVFSLINLLNNETKKWENTKMKCVQPL
jgi:hypothetical protein